MMTAVGVRAWTKLREVAAISRKKLDMAKVQTKLISK
jgi:hypothetical protein